ncbi:response regulator [Mesonia aquimarina]|uniref:response regulator n=1 Tax=Mesonia aquimarina TaxID=1504967 RepID=UPI000EF59F2F|nr:response regulator [Mesonia aquimarina]
MSYKVLLIDDDPIINLVQSKVINSVFPASDLKVFTDAKEALTYLKFHQEQACLIFLDINMPLMNAWDFLVEMQNEKAFTNVKVIIVSSSIDQSDKDKAAKFDMVIDFISKPLTKKHLRRFEAYFHEG